MAIRLPTIQYRYRSMSLTTRKVAVVGDSQLTNPWVTQRLCEHGYTVANMSVWGQPMTKCTVSPEAVNAVNPDLVIVALGVNDGLQLADGLEFAQAYREFLLKIEAPVLCFGPIPNKIKWLNTALYRWWVHAVCLHIEHADYIGHIDVTHDMPDNIHPQERGSIEIADYLASAIANTGEIRFLESL